MYMIIIYIYMCISRERRERESVRASERAKEREGEGGREGGRERQRERERERESRCSVASNTTEPSLPFRV